MLTEQVVYGLQSLLQQGPGWSRAQGHPHGMDVEIPPGAELHRGSQVDAAAGGFGHKGLERAKECPACGRLVFPRLDPAIIVLIGRGDELLLARAENFPGRWYSSLAGFVEPGETLEEAVHREVMAEVGVTVRNLRYFGSQPWPFPHTLMVAFTAEYAGG